ncbi:MAG: arabinofuranosidase catalytic domain-containing protein [Polyangiaceae bacterium]
MELFQGCGALNHLRANFFEGVMTSGASSDKTDNAVQAKIVATGYGK